MMRTAFERAHLVLTFSEPYFFNLPAGPRE